MFTFEGVSLRPVEETDLEVLRSLRNEQSTWTNLTDIQLITAEQQKQWFQSIGTSSTRMYFVACSEKHAFLGMVRMDEIDTINRSARVGCDIFPELRGRGNGSKVFDVILKYCFDYLNLHRVWLAVASFNVVASKMYAKKGFRVEGVYREALYRNGAYHDYHLMSILAQEFKRGAADCEYK